MLTFVEGDDIFALEANVYVITVNCVGVMGTGVAQAFRAREPELYNRYRRECRNGSIRIGQGALYDKAPRLQYVLFPTKDNWRNPSSYGYITQGLHWFTEAASLHIHPDAKIVMPPLGCGNGKLSFAAVSLLIDSFAQNLHHDITVLHPWYDQPHRSLIT